jgi:ABC-type transport system involved in cytochrome c biogenesis permease subunit
MADNPRSMQRIILWTTLVAVAALTVLSVVGAYQGPEKAAELFNSPPLVVYWFLLAGLLLSGLVSFKRLVRSPGPLFGHVGALLILIGAMGGSTRFNAIAHRFFGSDKIRSGMMAVSMGDPTSELTDDATHREANLPFQLKLDDLWIEYYPLADANWKLSVAIEKPGAGGEPSAQMEPVPWAVGKEVPLPLGLGKIEVLDYLPHARPVYDANFPSGLEIVLADGNRLLLPAKVGAEAVLSEANLAVRITRVFAHLSVLSKTQVVDDANSPGPPVLEVLIGPPGDPNKRAFVGEEGIIMHNPDIPPLNMRYAMPPLIAAAPAPDGPPAIHFIVTVASTQSSLWFVPNPTQQSVEMPLEAKNEAVPHGHAMAHARSSLMFSAPMPMTKAYNAQIEVLEGGRPKATQMTRVNDPLNYGGYQFSLVEMNGDTVQLRVVSDTGLYVVYAGFILMTVGVMWVLWFRKAGKEPAAPELAVYRVVCLGFPVLTLGLVLGAWWGKLAWGDYWGWDPKELWGLASWLVFLAYLHWRYVYGRALPRANLGLAVVGLLAIVGTLFMVNQGFHSYSGSGKGLQFKWTLLGYLIMGAMVFYACAGVLLAFKERKIGMGFFGVGFLLALAAVATRWIEVDHLPLQNMFEVFLFLGVLALPISVFCRLYLHVGGEVLDAFLGVIILFPAAFVFTAEPQRLPPALQTWLFAPHVAAYMVAYVILAKAGLLALGQIFKRQAPLPDATCK